MLKDMISEEQRVEADLEKTERQQMERAKRFLQEQMLDSDFSWIKQTKKSSTATDDRTQALAAGPGPACALSMPALSPDRGKSSAGGAPPATHHRL